MTELDQRKCVPCEGGVKAFDISEIHKYQKKVDGWDVKSDKDKNYYLCKNAVKDVSLETADNALLAMKNWRGKEDLKNIKNETLIIWGDKDTSYNFDQVDTLKKNIKNSRLEIFKDCAHNVHLEQPDQFNNLVQKFISE